jgi:peptide/nickel transport system ATP-binding protein
VAHRVAVIYSGRIVEDAPVDALFRAPRHPYTRALLASLPRPFDAERPATLVTFPGAVPNRSAPPVPCAFAARCPFAAAVCEAAPVRLDADPTHRTACVRWQEVLDQPLQAPPTAAAAAPLAAVEAEPVLAVTDLDVRIGRHPLFRRLLGQPPQIVHAVTAADFAIYPGETLGLVGESGCGKSSLARVIAGLRDFDGTVRFAGRDIAGPAAMDKAYRAGVQMVFQNPDSSLNPRQRVGTILSRPLRLYQGLAGAALRDGIAELLTSVELPADYAGRYPHQLSGGEKQRVAIARAIAARPAVMICDEITSGLDASVQAAIVNLLRAIQAERGIAFLFISHDLNLVRYLADRVVTMYLGQFVELCDAADLALPPYHPYTEALLSSAPALDDSVDVRRVRLQGSMPTRTGALAGCPFESRCPHRIDARCADETPPLRQFDGKHWLRCHLSVERLRTGEPIWRRNDGPTPDTTRSGGTS